MKKYFLYMSGVPVIYDISVNRINRVSNTDYIIPINSGEYTALSGEISTNMKKACYLSKEIKILTYISIFFSLCLSFFSPYFLIPIVISLVGWFGAHHYTKSACIVYILYLILITFVRDYFFMYKFLDYSPSKRGDLYIEMILICISSMINIWVVMRVIVFVNIISDFDYNILERLYENKI